MLANLVARLVQLALDLATAVIRGLLGAPVKAVEHAVQPILFRSAKPHEVIDVRHAVLREGRPRDTAIFDGDDAGDTRHWVADRSGLVIGVVSVMRRPAPEPCDAPRPQWQLRGMATLPEYRGQGLGAALLRQTQLDVAEPMWCNARERVVGFYAREGWVATGEPFDIPPIGNHVRMVWRG